MSRRIFLLLSLTSPLAAAPEGSQLYALHCSACHGTDGLGATGGTSPPLSGSPWVTGDADRAVKIVLKGIHGPLEVEGKTYNLEMPPQGAVLSDEQIAAILTHVRTSWNNQASPVSTESVQVIRAAVAGRQAPWTAEEILKLHPLPLAKTALSGLIAHSYQGKWDTMPDFSALQATHVEEEHDGILSLKNAPFENHFAMTWQGRFEAPADGSYEFLLDADDEAIIYLDGNKVMEIRGPGPMNGSRVKKQRVVLTKGSHAFRVEFVEFADQQGLAIGWKGPGNKGWKWLTDRVGDNPYAREPIPIAPSGERAVIYRNFIAGTTPRAIGVGFPGGLNLAWSADHLAAELIWTGDFMDGAQKWIDRGTDHSPPAGENVIVLGNERTLPADARFRGYQLDSAGNPTFSVQIGSGILKESWQARDGALVRGISLVGGPAINLVISAQPLSGVSISSEGAPLHTETGATTLRLSSGDSATLTYRWKP